MQSRIVMQSNGIGYRVESRQTNVRNYPATICAECGKVEAMHTRSWLCEECREERHRRLSRERLQLIRGPKKPIRKRRCECCHDWFQPQRPTAKYCSTRCRVAAHRKRTAKKSKRK